MRPLISTARLAELLGGPLPPTLLDVRWSLAGPPARELYARGHLPGAAFLDLDSDLAGPPGAGGRHPLPEPAALQAALRRAGIRQDHPVVAYDASDGSVAARAWWLLRWSGHTEVAVLDGGFAAWLSGGRPVVAGEPAEEPANEPADEAGNEPGDQAGDVSVQSGAMPVLGADEAAALAGSGVLLDARAAQRYRGEAEPIDPRAGHIPGARSAPAAGHVGEDGRWLPPEELARRFAELGVRAGEPVGAYCGSGVNAAAVVLALEVAGVTTASRPAALYAGSWSHWCTDPKRPVATGAGHAVGTPARP